MPDRITPCYTVADAEHRMRECLRSAYGVVVDRNDEGEARAHHYQLLRLARAYREMASTLRGNGRG